MTAPLLLEPVAEYQTRRGPAPAPSRDDERLADRLTGRGRDPKLTVRWLSSGNIEVSATSWVGVVGFSSGEIRVVPKLCGGSLGVFRMLDYITDVGMLRTLDEQRLPDVGANLFDVLCQLLADETQRLLRDGLLRDYRTVDDTIEVKRGRIRHRDQMLRRFGQLDKLECTFDEYDGDVPDNQLLAAALRIARRKVQDPKLKRQLTRSSQILQGACEPPTADSAWYRSRIAYNRRNDRYRTAHVLAHLVLQGQAFDDPFKVSPTKSSTFMIEMNALFESFVSALFENSLAGSNLTVSAQHVVRATVMNDRTNRTYSTIRPDLLLRRMDRTTRVPVDVKYKRYDQRKISTDDIYQTFLYAYALNRSSDVGVAAIIHPSEGAHTNVELSIRDSGGVTGARIFGIGLDIPEILDGLSGSAETRARVHRDIARVALELLSAGDAVLSAEARR